MDLFGDSDEEESKVVKSPEKQSDPKDVKIEVQPVDKYKDFKVTESTYFGGRISVVLENEGKRFVIGIELSQSGAYNAQYGWKYQSWSNWVVNAWQYLDKENYKGNPTNDEYVPLIPRGSLVEYELKEDQRGSLIYANEKGFILQKDSTLSIIQDG